MKNDQDNLPLRKTPSGEQIDTRPIQIEQWLTTLSYADFDKTGQLLYEATLATNLQLVKPSVRMELVELYNRPYQYYIDSRIKTEAQYTLQSIETAQSQVNILKRIAMNLGYACKMAAEEELKQKTLWRHTKPPLPAMLSALNYLSHALIFSYLEYSPIPKKIWQEINFIYDYAETLGKENTILPLPASDAGHTTNTIAQAYKRLVLASLADPYQLPFGAIWEIFEQLHSWAGYVHITRYSATDAPAGYFVVDLNGDSAPVPYFKFNQERITDKHRLIDATRLSKLIQEKCALLNRGEKLKDNLRLSPHYARLILGHLSQAWSLPPKRYFPREERRGMLYMTCGLKAVYFSINRETEYFPEQDDTAASPDYEAEEWELVDQSLGGVAVIRNARPSCDVRIGDLVAMSNDREKINWTVGVVRWMMVYKTRNYKIGIQVISKTALAVAVRALSGSAQDCRFQRALSVSEGGEQSLITTKGLYMKDRELEIKTQDGTFEVKATSMKESTLGFEHFNIRH